MDELREFWFKYKWRIISVIAGIMLTALLLTIGFWRTLLLLFVVGVCYFIGMLLDKKGRNGIKNFFNNNKNDY